MLSLVVAAIVLVPLAILHNVAPASCGDGNDARTSGQLLRAETAYKQILTEEPTSSCARSGMRLVASALCRRANEMRPRASDEAEKLYVAILAKEPRDPAAVECALNGLNRIGGSDGKADDKDNTPTVTINCSCSCKRRCTTKDGSPTPTPEGNGTPKPEGNGTATPDGNGTPAPSPTSHCKHGQLPCTR